MNDVVGRDSAPNTAHGGNVDVRRMSDMSGHGNHVTFNTSGSLVLFNGPHGQYVGMDSTATAANAGALGTQDILDSANEPFTVCIRYATHLYTTTIRAMFNFLDSAYPSEAFIGIWESTGGRGDLGFGWESATRTYDSGALATTLAAETWYDWVIVFDSPGSQTSSTSFTHYHGPVNGYLEEQSVNTTSSFVVQDTENRLNQSNGFAGSFLFNAVAVWRRAFTHNEVMMWHNNPWQGFQGSAALASLTTEGVNITDVDGDESWSDGATGLVITGTGFT
jgi:hypothetical protein